VHCYYYDCSWVHCSIDNKGCKIKIFRILFLVLLFWYSFAKEYQRNIAGGITEFGSSMGTTFLQRWITRLRIPIDEQITEVRMNYNELDSDQPGTMDENQPV
jgi:hypothetical protein